MAQGKSLKAAPPARATERAQWAKCDFGTVNGPKRRQQRTGNPTRKGTQTLPQAFLRGATTHPPPHPPSPHFILKIGVAMRHPCNTTAVCLLERGSRKTLTCHNRKASTCYLRTTPPVDPWSARIVGSGRTDAVGFPSGSRRRTLGGDSLTYVLGIPSCIGLHSADLTASSTRCGMLRSNWRWQPWPLKKRACRSRSCIPSLMQFVVYKQRGPSTSQMIITYRRT